MSATLRASLVPKVLELVVGENCCNFQWVREWLRAISAVVISVYLSSSDKVNSFSEKGSIATLLLGRGLGAQISLPDRDAGRRHWRKTQPLWVPLGIHSSGTGVKHSRATSQPAAQITSSSNTLQDTKDSRAKSFYLFTYCKVYEMSIHCISISLFNSSSQEPLQTIPPAFQETRHISEQIKSNAPQIWSSCAQWKICMSSCTHFIAQGPTQGNKPPEPQGIRGSRTNPDGLFNSQCWIKKKKKSASAGRNKEAGPHHTTCTGK